MQMRQYRYRVTLEQLTDSHGVPTDRKPLQFEVGNHDDIISVVTWIRSRGDFSSQAEAAAFGVGLKLFGGAILANKDDPLLSALCRFVWNARDSADRRGRAERMSREVLQA